MTKCDHCKEAVNTQSSNYIKIESFGDVVIWVGRGKVKEIFKSVIFCNTVCFVNWVMALKKKG